MVVFCFSNASHGIIAFMMNNSLPSEEIRDSHHSRSTRPWGNPVSSSALLFRFPKASRASLCLSHLRRLLSIRVRAFSFGVARPYASPVPLSDLLPAHTSALLRRADKNAKFKVFLGGEDTTRGVGGWGGVRGGSKV